MLAYTLSPIQSIGIFGIWIAVPIGWILADITGFIYMKKITASLTTIACCAGIVPVFPEICDKTM